MDEVTFSIVDAGSEGARWAMDRYFDEIDDRFTGGFDRTGALESAAEKLCPPLGVFVIAERAGEIVGCGGLEFIDGDTAEIKRMWVSPAARGIGLGRKLLADLEEQANDAGRQRVVLDTNSSLAEAINMYRTSGYSPIERYNDNPYAQLWFEKRRGRTLPVRPSGRDRRR